MNDGVETSANNFLSFIHKLLGDFIINHELLNPEHIEQPSSDVEKSQHAQHHNCYREVNVEAVSNKPNHVHVSHYLYKYSEQQ